MEPSTLAPLTADEFFHHPDAQEASELVRGEIVMMTPAGGRHNVIALRVAMRLTSFVEAQGLGMVFTDNLGYDPPIPGATRDTVRAPDASFVRAGRLPGGEVPIGFLRCAPDLAVEVLSPDDRPGALAARLTTRAPPPRLSPGSAPAQRRGCPACASFEAPAGEHPSSSGSKRSCSALSAALSAASVVAGLAASSANARASVSSVFSAARLAGVSHAFGTGAAAQARAASAIAVARARAGARSLFELAGCQVCIMSRWKASISFQPPAACAACAAPALALSAGAGW
jgi:hypothetical protein